DQRGLAEDVVADHSRREPGKVQVAAALDQLQQVIADLPGLRAPDDVLGVDASGVRQRVPGAGAQRLHRFAGIEPVERGSWEWLAVLAVGHGGRGQVAVGKRILYRRAATCPG